MFSYRREVDLESVRAPDWMYLLLKIHLRITCTTNLGVLFSGNSCARKMLRLWLADYEDVSSFHNQLKLKGKFGLAYLIYLAQHEMANYMHNQFRSTFCGNSCARKMLHLWLAGYEYVSSFLNQLKLKGKFRLAYLIYLAQREMANYMHNLVLVIMRIL